MDHHDGKVMVETMVIRELIPRIDERYRTIASRAGRAVHGFSMGASGALKFTIKYPEMFCAAVAYGGGAIDLANTRNQFVLDILERNLKSDRDLVRQNNTYHFLEKKHTAVRENGTRFFLICGDEDSWKESAVTFQAALKARGIPCDLTLVPDAGHDLRKTFAARGEAAALFQDELFKETLSSFKASVAETREHVIERTYMSKLTYRCIVTVPAEYDADHDRAWPMILFLHGGGTPKPEQLRRSVRTLTDLPAIVVAPLCPPSADQRMLDWLVRDQDLRLNGETSE
jgi:dipeptidyl aminopeptidase/acylaminoacyl peptidase